MAESPAQKGFRPCFSEHTSVLLGGTVHLQALSKGLCDRADIHKISAETIPQILRHKNLSTPERYIKRVNEAFGAIVDLLSRKGYHGGPPGAKEEPNAS